jgi:hypothetical protein
LVTSGPIARSGPYQSCCSGLCEAANTSIELKPALTAILVFMTIDWDILHFGRAGHSGHISQPVPAIPQHPDGFKTVILLTGFSALRYRP